MMKISKEAFEAWRAHAVTEFILDLYVAERMKLAKDTHDEKAWEGPLAPEDHAVYREHYETLESLRELTFEDLAAWFGGEDEKDETQD